MKKIKELSKLALVGFTPGANFLLKGQIDSLAKKQVDDLNNQKRKALEEEIAELSKDRK